MGSTFDSNDQIYCLMQKLEICDVTCEIIKYSIVVIERHLRMKSDDLELNLRIAPPRAPLQQPPGPTPNVATFPFP